MSLSLINIKIPSLSYSLFAFNYSLDDINITTPVKLFLSSLSSYVFHLSIFNLSFAISMYLASFFFFLILIPSKSFLGFFNLFIFGCIGSLLLCAGFL